MSHTNNDFYTNFFGCTTEKATRYKIEYLKNLITENSIFKFIQFSDDVGLNNQKLTALKNGLLWFSHHRYLNDPSEYEMAYDKKRVCKKTGMPESDIDFAFGTQKDLYELCSFTYENNEYMWSQYSNNGNGFCIEFGVNNYDLLYPVIYCDKSEFNFTEMIIRSILLLKKSPKLLFETNDPVSILRYILKNPMNGKLNSADEKEVRMLYAPTDNKEFNDGILYPNAKENQGFNGIYVHWTDLELTIKSVIIGNDCAADIKSDLEIICANRQYKVKYK